MLPFVAISCDVPVLHLILSMCLCLVAIYTEYIWSFLQLMLSLSQYVGYMYSSNSWVLFDSYMKAA